MIGVGFGACVAEYRTVSGVSGPLVILENVKVGEFKIRGHE